jgi:hypothetical protein
MEEDTAEEEEAKGAREQKAIRASKLKSRKKLLLLTLSRKETAKNCSARLERVFVSFFFIARLDSGKNSILLCRLTTRHTIPHVESLLSFTLDREKASRGELFCHYSNRR